MYEITKKMNLKTGKVTYTRTVAQITVSVVATCQAEAERKLALALLEQTSLDAILDHTIQTTIKKYRGLLALANTETDLLRQQLAERNKPWYRRLGLWSH